eukprot:m.119527 g.119527  ORF g.119527 m.119527 type:complete len:317 (-) comp16152_c3_seq1:803-1753(-)
MDAMLFYLIIGTGAVGLVALVMLIICCRRRCSKSRVGNKVEALPKIVPHKASFRTIDILVKSLPELEPIPETRVDIDAFAPVCATTARANNANTNVNENAWTDLPEPPSFIGEVSIKRMAANDEEGEEGAEHIGSEQVFGGSDFTRRQTGPAHAPGTTTTIMSQSSVKGNTTKSADAAAAMCHDKDGSSSERAAAPAPIPVICLNVSHVSFDFHALSIADVTRSEAEAMLNECGRDQAGAFLFRKGRQHTVVLSMCADNTVQHFNINLDGRPGCATDLGAARLSIFVKHYRNTTDGFLPVPLKTYVMKSGRRMTAA